MVKIKMIKQKFLKGFLVSLLAGTFLFLPFSASAQQSGIQISPVTYNFDIKPGETQKAKITLTNLNDEELNFVTEKENFSNVSEEGAPSFAAKDLKEGVTSLADWITFDDQAEGKLAAKKEKEIIFTISIPEGAEPGGHYAAVFAKQIKKTAEGKTELGVSSRVGTLILVSIPGATSKNAEITEFRAPKLVLKGPIECLKDSSDPNKVALGSCFTMKVKNTGTVHFDSKGTVEIRSLFGQVSTVDLGTHTIIPQNIRSFFGGWDKKYPFGYYRLTATATDGEGKPITATAAMWAIPLIIVLPALVIIIIIIMVWRFVKRNYKVVSK